MGRDQAEYIARLEREIERLRIQNETDLRVTRQSLKRAETVEAQVQALREEAQRIMREKGSYDVAIDPRVLREYERAYTFIQQLADATPPAAAGEEGRE